MARIAIRVLGQCQKHGASLADEIAKWLLRFSGDHHLTTPDTHIHPCGPHPSSTRTLFRSRRRYRHHCHCSRLVAAISAIVPSAVVAAVVLVSLPPQPPSLPLPLLVDCCLLFVSNAVAVAATAAIVAINAPTAVVVVAAPAAVTVAVVVATITVAATGNAVGGGGGAELMG